ncbi:MAG: phenylalanine--tRNA ligase subunit beta [Planctomycetes bacterium RBG_13_63_9]|nr:MAG: phenylalanine--tRNA ligase subunit beta [Planctomycetes bacterium RBG_13_63_9]
MIVSWNWLKQYVPLDMPLAELERRLMMSGLNHEGTEEVGGDLAIDLEVTSNRPDCLGHIGVAREIAVLWESELTIPTAEPAQGATPVDELLNVRIDCPDLCSRYTARVIRGVKIGPSPSWMVRRLETVGITPINNVVDISNYVLMECGQPLHTFDFAKLAGAEIVVRRPRSRETIEAIDHKRYELGPDTCVIADARRPVAIGGVMGGAVTEISNATTDLLIEAAEFEPVSIRNTARVLNLHSDSSYRFERRVDPEGIDWASRRCCELILQLTGGELAKGSVDVGDPVPKRQPIVLRLAQLKRVLGIDVPADQVRRILVALGNVEVPHPGSLPQGEGGEPIPHPNPLPKGEGIEFIPPSWRRDLTREIDLVEEVGRIHGYEQIPEDVGVPMVASTRTRSDRVEAKIRNALTAFGFDEAMTASVVDEKTARMLSLWTDAEPLRSLTPVLRGADRLRTSLIPSLLAARRTNEALANAQIELFEIARVYLPEGKKLPDEQPMLGITSGRDYLAVKGAVEALVATLNPAVELQAAELEAAGAGCRLFDPQQSCRLELDGIILGYVGRLDDEGLKQFELRLPTTVAEVKLSLLVQTANLVPRHVPQPPYPAVSRDLNLVVDDEVRWSDVAATVAANCGELLEELRYCDTYRDPKQIGPGKKSLLMAISLRSHQGTMTSQEADAVRDRIVTACREKHGAELRA